MDTYDSAHFARDIIREIRPMASDEAKAAAAQAQALIAVAEQVHRVAVALEAIATAMGSRRF